MHPVLALAQPQHTWRTSLFAFHGARQRNNALNMGRYSHTSIACSQVSTVPDGGVLSPIFFMACLNSSRSSALLIDGSLAPMSSTPYFSSSPVCKQRQALEYGKYGTYSMHIQGLLLSLVKPAGQCRRQPRVALV